MDMRLIKGVIHTEVSFLARKGERDGWHEVALDTPLFHVLVHLLSVNGNDGDKNLVVTGGAVAKDVAANRGCIHGRFGDDFQSHIRLKPKAGDLYGLVAVVAVNDFLIRLIGCIDGLGKKTGGGNRAPCNGLDSANVKGHTYG